MFTLYQISSVSIVKNLPTCMTKGKWYWRDGVHMVWVIKIIWWNLGVNSLREHKFGGFDAAINRWGWMCHNKLTLWFSMAQINKVQRKSVTVDIVEDFSLVGRWVMFITWPVIDQSNAWLEQTLEHRTVAGPFAMDQSNLETTLVTVGMGSWEMSSYVESSHVIGFRLDNSNPNLMKLNSWPHLIILCIHQPESRRDGPRAYL